MQPTTVSSLLPFLLLLLLAQQPWAVEAGKGSGESGECQTRRDTCDGLVDEPPTPAPPSTPQPATVPTPAPGQCVCTPAPATGGPGSSEEGGDFHSHCELIEAFYNMSLLLTISEQVEWEAWIQGCENEILANSSLSDDQKVVLISLSLKAFFSLHLDIYNQLSFVQIGGWGAVIDFLYVSIQIDLEITQSVVTVDGNGNCDLTEALQNGSSQCGCSAQEQSAIANLIVEIQAILEDSSYSYQQQLAVVWNLFQAFFVQNPQLESFVLSIDISGFGSIQALLDVCHTYERIVTLTTVISGNSSSDCPLLEGLQQATQNASFNLSVQVQINQLLLKLQAYFNSETDISLRLEYISATCYQMFLQEPWMVSIIEQITCGDWGAIYDIIFCSNICTNYGCGNPNDGPGPNGVSTSVGSTASPASTASSAASSSVAPTVKPADCTTVSNLITVNVTSNTTILTDVLTTAYGSWTASQKLGFNSCFNKLRNAIWNDVSFPTPTLKLEECQRDFWAYNNNSVTNQQLVFNLTINIWVGTIAQFVSCIH